MKELLTTINTWLNQNKPFAIATVIKTWGSSPRPVGSSLIISQDMEMAGSVSGGCVEGAVLKAALPLIKKGEGLPLNYGVTDEEAWGVGLSCGGKIQVYAERFIAFQESPAEQLIWQRLQQNLQQNLPSILLTRLQEGPSQHLLVMPNRSALGQKISSHLIDEAIRIYKERKHQVIEFEGTSYFTQIFPKKSQLLIIGAAHITVDLVTLGQLYGFETIVIDPRGIFANKTQFVTEPDKIYDQYPVEVLPHYDLDAYTYAVVLSHDPKIDDNALHILLRSEVGYIGALGSKKTHAKRMARLQNAGFTDEEITRIHAPIGVDIKAKTPQEIALSIMGEIIKVKNEFR